MGPRWNDIENNSVNKTQPEAEPRDVKEYQRKKTNQPTRSTNRSDEVKCLTTRSYLWNRPVFRPVSY